MKVSIVIPTVFGRERSLERTLHDYEYSQNSAEAEVIVVHGKNTCGEAWNEGAELATGDIVHFTADDISPAVGWLDAACRALEMGIIPAPKVHSPNAPSQASFGHDGDGALLPLNTPPLTPCKVTVIPIFRRDWWHKFHPPLLPIHYYSDDDFSNRAWAAGLPILTYPGYEFTHWFADGGARTNMASRILNDRATFMEATS